jgi:hypothetical protein
LQNLKFGVLVCGLLGLVGCFLPLATGEGLSISFFDYRKADAGYFYTIAAGYSLGLVMGAMGSAKGMQRWMSILAIAGFGVIVARMRGNLIDLLKQGIGAKLMAVGAVAGLIFSILTIVTPEPSK